MIDVYTIDAALSPEELERVRVELFTDPIIQVSALDKSLAREYDFVIEVGFRPGVTDNVGRSATEGIQDTLGRHLAAGEAVYKSTMYAVRGASRETCEHIAKDLLANALIQQYGVKSREEMAALDGQALLPLPIVTERSEAVVREVSLEISDDALMTLSRDGMLAPPSSSTVHERSSKLTRSRRTPRSSGTPRIKSGTRSSSSARRAPCA